jgi:hypothetical protein
MTQHLDCVLEAQTAKKILRPEQVDGLPKRWPVSGVFEEVAVSRVERLAELRLDRSKLVRGRSDREPILPEPLLVDVGDRLLYRDEVDDPLFPVDSFTIRRRTPSGCSRPNNERSDRRDS